MIDLPETTENLSADEIDQLREQEESYREQVESALRYLRETEGKSDASDEVKRVLTMSIQEAFARAKLRLVLAQLKQAGEAVSPIPMPDAYLSVTGKTRGLMKLILQPNEEIEALKNEINRLENLLTKAGRSKKPPQKPAMRIRTGIEIELEQKVGILMGDLAKSQFKESDLKAEINNLKEEIEKTKEEAERLKSLNPEDFPELEEAEERKQQALKLIAQVKAEADEIEAKAKRAAEDAYRRVNRASELADAASVPYSPAEYTRKYDEYKQLLLILRTLRDEIKVSAEMQKILREQAIENLGMTMVEEGVVKGDG